MAANAPPPPPGDLTINIGTVPPGKFLDAETARRLAGLQDQLAKLPALEDEAIDASIVTSDAQPVDDSELGQQAAFRRAIYELELGCGDRVTVRSGALAGIEALVGGSSRSTVELLTPLFGGAIRLRCRRQTG